jgi:hypothetical protein
VRSHLDLIPSITEIFDVLYTVIHGSPSNKKIASRVVVLTRIYAVCYLQIAGTFAGNASAPKTT